MKIYDIINTLEETAPLNYQEKYDNSGLQCGDISSELKNVLITLDCTIAIVNEAIDKKCNLIIAHHPIIFGGINRIDPKNPIGAMIIQAIKNDIVIYACHTNLDNIKTGVNSKIAELLGLKNTEILAPKKRLLKKLHVFCPNDHADKLRNALFEKGAGEVGAYSECSFNINGKGTFKAGSDTTPFVGKKELRHNEEEVKIEVIFPSHLESDIISSMIKNHPYEEVAFDIYLLENKYQLVGSGMIGTIDKISTHDFFDHIKNKLNSSIIRHTEITKKHISKIALCGGSGSFLLSNAIQKKADIFISSDFKYHQFFDANNQIIIADIGHYESEQFTKDLIYEILSQNFPNIALLLSEVNTNPINYY
jgi:dinuclear metal center YbgI/SA1388 family protein